MPDVVAISRMSRVMSEVGPITSASDFASRSASRPCMRDAMRRRRVMVSANRAFSTHDTGIFMKSLLASGAMASLPLRKTAESAPSPPSTSSPSSLHCATVRASHTNCAPELYQ